MQAAALITAAGLSTRFNTALSQQKKELISIDGMSSLHRCVSQCISLSYIKLIIITHPEGDQLMIDHIAALSQQYEKSCVILPITGGETRQDSVRLGLETLDAYAPQMVIIHDGARPWITSELIDLTYKQALKIGGAAPGLLSRNALKDIDNKGIITSHHKRERIVEIQTPQVFIFAQILAAHRAALSHNKQYIDDTEIFTDHGGIVAVVPGDSDNVKITYRTDVKEHL